MRWSWFFATIALGGCATADTSGDGGELVDALPRSDAPPADAPASHDAAIDATLPDDAQPLDAPPLPDAGSDAQPTQQILLDDAAGDFAGAGALASDATVEAWGAVEPIAYFTGGLLQRASDTGFFTDPTVTTWAGVTGLPQTGKNAIARASAMFWGAGTPWSVGLTNGDYWTQTFEGEVFLEAGTWTFYLWVDDHGFVELADAETGVFTRVVNANWDIESSGQFVASTTGWYPIRYAVAEEAGDALVRVQAQGPGFATQLIPRQRLRARTDAVAGWYQAGFDDAHLLGGHQSTIDAVTPGDTNWNTGNPGDLAMTDSELFSVRWSGQVRVMVGGSYTFRYVTDDGQRLWVDGVRVLDAWDTVTHDNLTAPINLAPGWHDLVVDQLEWAGGAMASLSIQSGPEGAGAVIPLARMRPVEGRGERYETGFDRNDAAIPDLGQAQSTVTLQAPAAATARGVDISYSLTHSYWGDLEVRLIAPSGATWLLRDNAGGASSGTLDERFYTTALDNAAVDGVWTLRVNDTASSDAGTLLDFQLTVHHAAGEPPIAPASSFESPVNDLGDVVSLDDLSWSEVAPPGTDVVLRLRTGATAEACQAAAWSLAFTAPGGTAPTGVPVARFLQYRIEMTSSGDASPWVDWVRLAYSEQP